MMAISQWNLNLVILLLKHTPYTSQFDSHDPLAQECALWLVRVAGQQRKFALRAHSLLQSIFHIDPCHFNAHHENILFMSLCFHNYPAFHLVFNLAPAECLHLRQQSANGAGRGNTLLHAAVHSDYEIVLTLLDNVKRQGFSEHERLVMA